MIHEIDEALRGLLAPAVTGDVAFDAPTRATTRTPPHRRPRTKTSSEAGGEPRLHDPVDALRRHRPATSPIRQAPG